MLLATYQPENWRECKREKYKMLEKEIGYSPIFCISAENIEELIIQSYLAAPNCPEYIILFESTEYDTLDIVLYNKYLINEKCPEILRAAINNNSDKKYQEYMVSSITNIKREITLQDFFSIENINAFNNLEKGASYNKEIQTLLVTMANREFAEINIKTDEDSSEEDIQFARKLLMKETFQKWLLPFVAIENPQKIIAGKLDSATIWSDVTHELGYFYNKMKPEDYITYVNFDRMYAKIRSLLLPLDDMLVKKKYFPNDKCWCGSGLKYKICHGKYFS